MSTLLTNATFIDVVAGQAFAETALLLKGDRIADILPANTAEGFSGDRIDLGGRFVVPGLLNSHCHLTATPPTLFPTMVDIWSARLHQEKQIEHNLAQCLEYGICTVRDAYCADLRNSQRLKEQIRQGQTPGPQVLQSVAVGPPGSYFGETFSRFMQLGRSALGAPCVDYERAESGTVIFPIDASAQQVFDAVDRAIDERGAQAIKIGEQLADATTLKPTATIMSQQQLNALAEQARRRGVCTLMHHSSVDSLRRASQAGLSTLSHLSGDQLLQDRDIEQLLASGVTIEATLSSALGLSWQGVGEEDPFLDWLTELRQQTFEQMANEFYVPELAQRVILASQKMQRAEFKFLGFIDMARHIAYYTKNMLCGVANFRKLWQAGAPFIMGNDGGVPPSTPAMIGAELLLMRKTLQQVDAAPLSSLQILRMCTIDTARAMGLEQQCGSIASGKRADLAVFDRNPLVDTEAIGQPVAALILGGEIVVNKVGLAKKRSTVPLDTAAET